MGLDRSRRDGPENLAGQRPEVGGVGFVDRYLQPGEGASHRRGVSLGGHRVGGVGVDQVRTEPHLHPDSIAAVDHTVDARGRRLS
jgi:hypothetical protein